MPDKRIFDPQRFETTNGVGQCAVFLEPGSLQGHRRLEVPESPLEQSAVLAPQSSS